MDNKYCNTEDSESQIKIRGNNGADSCQPTITNIIKG